jgi:hypothetical protein
LEAAELPWLSTAGADKAVLHFEPALDKTEGFFTLVCESGNLIDLFNPLFRYPLLVRCACLWEKAIAID